GGEGLRRFTDVLPRPDHRQPPARAHRLVSRRRPRARASAGIRRRSDLADRPCRQLGAGRPRARPAFRAHHPRGGRGGGGARSRALAPARRQRDSLRAEVAPDGLPDLDRGPPARRGGGAAGRPRARQSRRRDDPVLRTSRALSGRPLPPCARRGGAGRARVLHARRGPPLRLEGAAAPEDRARRRGGSARRVGRHARANRGREADAVVQFLRRRAPRQRVRGGVGREEAGRRSRELGAILHPRISPPFTGTFIRSATLYDEYVLRLTAGIFRATGLAKAAETQGTTDELVTRAGFEPGRARVPVDWMLRRLSHRGILEQRDLASGHRFQLRGPAAELLPPEV